MMRSTLRGSAASARSARATPPVSGCDRYSTPAGERYCTDWLHAGVRWAAPVTISKATKLRIPVMTWLLGSLGCLGNNRGRRCFVDDQLKDVGPTVMSRDVEVELCATNLVEIEIGGQDGGAVEAGTGEHLAERAHRRA